VGAYLMGTCRFLFIVGAAAYLSGCAVGPDYVTPDFRVPTQFSASRTPTSTPSVAPTADLAQWWRVFRDPELNLLVERAVAANPDIEIALSRVQEAREKEIVVLGAALPQVGLSGAAGTGSGSDSVKGRIPQSLDAGENTTGLTEITGVAGFDATWELDLFGKYRRQLEAARYDTEASIALRNGVLIAVVAEVARSYVILRGIQAQAAVVKSNIGVAQKTVDLVQTRFNRGLTNEFDVTLAKRELATLEAELPPLTAAIASPCYSAPIPKMSLGSFGGPARSLVRLHDCERGSPLTSSGAVPTFNKLNGSSHRRPPSLEQRRPICFQASP
jgi:outer membrane protein TolC